jgi:flagellum-specific peptidoglycan hydrolase FlgJ
VNDKAIEFKEALSIVGDNGFSPLAVFTHAWHESGGFKRVIGQHNYWGIKVPKNWQGLAHGVMTHEYVKGKRVNVIDYFIDFENVSAALNWYMGLIKRLYPESYAHRGEPEQYFKGLVSGRYKYATDPRYTGKLIDLCEYLKEINILSS